MIAPNQTFTGKVGVPFSQTPAHTGTISSWSLQSGSLPAGLSLNPATGLISGTPTTRGAFSSVISYPRRYTKIFANWNVKSALLDNGGEVTTRGNEGSQIGGFGLENKVYNPSSTFPPSTEYIDVALSDYWALMLKANGSLNVFGRTSNSGPGLAVPRMLDSSNNNIVGVATYGTSSGVALKSNGTVVDWRVEYSPFTGLWYTKENHYFTSNKSGISKIRGGEGLVLIKNDGSLLVHGFSPEVHGNYGTGFTDSWRPVLVNGSLLTGVVDVVVAGYVFSGLPKAALLILKNDGTVLLLKENHGGWPLFGPVPQLSGVTAIAAAQAYTFSTNTAPVFLAQKSDGSLVVWGGGADSSQPTPSAYLPPPGLIVTPATQENDRRTIAGGLQYFLALKNDGTVVGWGPTPGNHDGAGNSAQSPLSLTASINFVIEADASLTFDRLKAKSVFVGSKRATAVYYGSQRLL